jgi:glycosyltransferase involved in cell wall biosynthesis
VRFIDRLDDEAMVAYFRALDVFMLPTRREGFGMVFAEAMSQETPAIGPRMPPVDEIIADGETGCLVADQTPAAYAAAALSLLADPVKRSIYGAAARRRVRERFDEQRSFAQIEETYRRLLEARG